MDPPDPGVVADVEEAPVSAIIAKKEKEVTPGSNFNPRPAAKSRKAIPY
jgi:hypothetical protein